jgi:prepilin-type N-terminal cleavage/methylation domain-containing protein
MGRYLHPVILSFMRKGFTLVEVIIVVIIVGILVSFALPPFMVTKERALDSEATSVLGLIRDADRAYRMEQSTFYPAAGTDTVISTINTNLRLSIPTTSSWNYSVASTGIITATRTTGPRTPRVWTVSAVAAGTDPTCAGAGCL